MASEIIITSTPRGLTGGSGFQPVKRTRGMTPAVSERLTGRSGYNHIYSAGDPRNPTVISHRVEHVGRKYLNVLSVIRDAGTDHSGRSNRLAHLICVEASEAEGAKAGPAAVIRQLLGAKTFVVRGRKIHTSLMPSKFRKRLNRQLLSLLGMR